MDWASWEPERGNEKVPFKGTSGLHFLRSPGAGIQTLLGSQSGAPLSAVTLKWMPPQLPTFLPSIMEKTPWKLSSDQARNQSSSPPTTESQCRAPRKKDSIRDTLLLFPEHPRTLHMPRSKIGITETKRISNSCSGTRCERDGLIHHPHFQPNVEGTRRSARHIQRQLSAKGPLPVLSLLYNYTSAVVDKGSAKRGTAG